MKNFHFDGPTWAFLTPEQMYDEEGKLRRTHKHYQNADIYFMAIMNKCFFSPHKTRVTLNGRIRCEVCIGNPAKKKFYRKKLTFPLAEILYAMPGIKDRFHSSDGFLFFVLLNQYTPTSALKKRIYLSIIKLFKAGALPPEFAFKTLRAIYSSEIIVRHETRFEINIFDPVADAITGNEKTEETRKANSRFHDLNGEDWDSKKTAEIDYSKLPGAGEKENCRLTIDQIINHFDIDVGNQKIAYIGKTEQEPFDRLFPHKKLNELNAKLLKNEYETLIIHLFGFMSWDEPIVSWPPRTSISKADATTIAEAELINYFKPIENEKYVNNGGKSDWKHIKLLLREKYSIIRGLLDVDGQYAKFYTSHVGDNKLNRHEIDVELTNYRSAQREDVAS
jgi:hypothetical protein